MIRSTAVLLAMFALCTTGFPQTQTPPDSSKTIELSDSAKIAKESRRVELLDLLRESNRYLYDHPKSADTLFNPYTLNRIYLSRDDFFNWTEVLRNQGEFVPVFYSPQFQFNRALWRGYTIPLSGRTNSLLTGPATITQRSAQFEPIQVENLTVHSDGSLEPSLFPQTRISPQVFFAMENGLFDGNSLEFRVMRNLTRNLSLGVFSSYRDLKRYDFTHIAGGISSFYEGMRTVIDTHNISFEGRNPLSTNHISTVQVQWKKKSTINVTGHYEDLTNDQLYPFKLKAIQPKSTYDSIWYNRDDFNGSFNAAALIPLGDKSQLTLEGEAGRQVFHEDPVSTQLIHADSSYSGKERYLAGGTKFSLAPSEADTISFRATANQFVTTHRNNKISDVIRTDFIIDNSFISPNGLITLDGSAGASAISFEDSTDIYPVISGEARLTPGKFALESWGKIDLVPLCIPYESSFAPQKGLIGDYYWGTGVRASVAANKLSLSTGYSMVEAVDPYTVSRFWQNGVAPYTNPTNVITITPSFGEWHGISLSSSWNIADTKPTLKSTSRLDFHIHKGDRSRHFYTSILLNYWSERDPFYYAGRSDWGRPVIDLGTKFTAEIKSFRLFMKMDNLLNRNNSYVPGYYMPGLIFRWGFAWTITG